MKLILLLFVTFIAVGCSSETTTQTENNEVALETIAVSEDVQSAYDSVELRELIREPERYKGAEDMFVVKVFQTGVENDEYHYYLGTVTTSPSDSLTVMLALNKDTAHTKIIEGDEIRVLTKFADAVEYETTQNTTNEVPFFLVTSYQLAN